jgi:hypothetical protein
MQLEGTHAADIVHILLAFLLLLASMLLLVN